jgi:hypothetical protein
VQGPAQYSEIKSNILVAAGGDVCKVALFGDGTFFNGHPLSYLLGVTVAEQLPVCRDHEIDT